MLKIDSVAALKRLPVGTRLNLVGSLRGPQAPSGRVLKAVRTRDTIDDPAHPSHGRESYLNVTGVNGYPGPAPVDVPAIFVLRSMNAKIGAAAATYASIDATCPSSCKLRDAGCYAQAGKVGFHVRRLRGRATPLGAARYEASLIDAAG